MKTSKVCFLYENSNGDRSIRWATLGDAYLSSNDDDPMPQLVVSAWDIKKMAFRSFAVHKMLYVKPLTWAEVKKSRVNETTSLPKDRDVILLIAEQELSDDSEIMFRKSRGLSKLFGSDILIGWREIES